MRYLFFSVIEVEKKFKLNEADRKRLTNGAKFLGERIFTDFYYDLPDYALTKADKWLRSRNGKFELKLGLVKEWRHVTRYEELESEKEIRDHLQIPKKKSLEEDVKERGYKVFCIVKTKREKYQKGEFIIDFDDVRYPEHKEFRYRLAEIELMVGDTSEMKDAEKKILAFAKEYKLNILPIRGKIFEYLHHKAPEHLALLVKAGVARAGY